MTSRSSIGFGLFAVALAGLYSSTAYAEEFYIGEPVVMNELQIIPNYLTDIKMSHMAKGTSMKPDAVHLEADIHAIGGEKHGFAEDAWIPYLTVHYTLEKVGSDFKVKGVLVPMTASDGPHYANNVDFDGPGKYHLTYTIDPPSKTAFVHHIDAKTGVPDWWKSFSADWVFSFPGEPK